METKQKLKTNIHHPEIMYVTSNTNSKLSIENSLSPSKELIHYIHPSSPPSSSTLSSLSFQSIPQLPIHLSSSVMDLDKIMTLDEMNFQWDQLKQKIKQSVIEQLHEPLQSWHQKKSLSKLDQQNTNDYEKSIHKLETNIRIWLENQKRILFYINPTTVSNHHLHKEYKKYIKAAFNEELDQIYQTFENSWKIKIHDVLHDSIQQLKKKLTPTIRNIKPPISYNQKQEYLLKILNVRGDPEKCSFEQAHIYDESIKYLKEQLENQIPFSEIEKQMEPLSDIISCLDHIWQQYQTLYLSNVNKIESYVQPIVKEWYNQLYNQLFNQLYNQHQHSLNWDRIKTLDEPYWIKIIINQLIKKLNHPLNKRKTFIFEGSFRLMLQNYYFSHKINMNMYIKHALPKNMEQWIQEDIKKISLQQYNQQIQNRIQLIIESYLQQIHPLLEKYKKVLLFKCKKGKLGDLVPNCKKDLSRFNDITVQNILNQISDKWVHEALIHSHKTKSLKNFSKQIKFLTLETILDNLKILK